MPLKPLVKWSGGKRDELTEILPHLPEIYETYIEPFAGGASLYFHLKPHNAVLADVHEELIALYQQIKEGRSQEIIDFMDNHPNDEETYYHVRDTLVPMTPLEKAARFYYLRKTCYRGMLRYNKQGKFNIPFGKYKTINYAELSNPDYQTLLERTEILQTDFDEVFDRYGDNPENFIFLDPPYDTPFTDYGYCKFDRTDQQRLFDRFAAAKAKCMMVISETDYIRDLYKDYIKGSYQKAYRFRLHSGRIKSDDIDKNHLIIKNY